jgi:three-Cys-motif partner protein
VKPNTVLWEADEHTLAKHQILRGYLQAWLPMMSRWEQRVLLIDGFAGPGRYVGGELGSPLIMLRTLLDHGAFATRAATTFSFLFIEQNHERIEHLRQEVAALGPLPNNVRVIPPIEGNFADVMSHVFEQFHGLALVPTFAFIDPFGYKDTAAGLTGQILSFPKCEVLIYLPLYNIARFMREPDQEAVLNNLYGDESWKAAWAAGPFEEAQDILHDRFADVLLRHCKHVRSFELLGKTTNSGYHLFFGTSSEDGIRRMKAAMWKVDPEHGARFRDSTRPGQTILFEFGPDLMPLLGMLKAKFGTEPFSIEAAAQFVLLDTAFRDDAHLKEPILKPAEDAGRLEAWKSDGSKRRRGTYPEGTMLRFKE